MAGAATVIDKPLFVVHVIHHLMIGGLENGLVNLINHLPHERFRHAVICIEDFSEFRQRIERDDVEVHAMHRSKIGTWRLRWRLWRLLSRLKPDIVHTRNLSGLDALLPARLAGIKTLHSEHGFEVGDVRGRFTKLAWLRRLHTPLVGHYVTVSRDLRRLLTVEIGIAPARITQIYNGVDAGRFCPNRPPRRDSLPPQWQAETLFVVGTVGRVRPIKDQATLLRALAAVLQRRPPWRARLRLVLVGDGPSLPALQQLAAELGITDQVWFAGARHDVAALLQAMDLFVLPSLNEGISNTLLEAMATGLPVLATAVGGNVELLDENVVGASFAPGDHAGLATMIENYAGNAEKTADHGAAARRRVLAHFSLPAMVAAYRDTYEML